MAHVAPGGGDISAPSLRVPKHFPAPWTANRRKIRPRPASAFRYRHPNRRASGRSTLGSVGVVYGDIGTSPLYAFREAVNARRPGR